MKKLFTLAGSAAFLAGAFLVVSSVANAQTVSGGGGSVAGSAGPAVIVSPGMPVPIVPPVQAVNSGFIQFDNLTVQSVSRTIPTAEILATNPNIMTVVPMIYSGTGSTSAPANNITCYSFSSQNAANGTPVACPVPPTATTAPTAPTTAPSATNAAGTSAQAPMPFRYQPYRIEIDASTQLYLRDRTPATLGSFAPGDSINVFGYYNADGSIQAYLVRDTAKPVQSEVLQVNNADLVSVTASGTVTTLVVAQQNVYPCYGFDANGNNKQGIVCPMSVSTDSSARKYVVTVDGQTIILDSNRTKLQLSDLQIGDELNIYGESDDNGQTVNADIVRDLSIPATAQTYNGTVTQVNTNGTFVVQTGDGRTITVTSPITVGATLQLTGVLDRLQNVLSQVSNIMSGTSINGGTVASPPVPVSAPGMLRIQGSTTTPPTPAGTPNIY